MSSEPPLSGFSSGARKPASWSRARLVAVGDFLHRLGEDLLLVSPGWQADALDIALHHLCNRLVEVARRGCADELAGDRRVGHHRGGLRDAVAGLVILLDFSKSISRKKYQTDASDGSRWAGHRRW